MRWSGATAGVEKKLLERSDFNTSSTLATNLTCVPLASLAPLLQVPRAGCFDGLLPGPAGDATTHRGRGEDNQSTG